MVQTTFAVKCYSCSSDSLKGCGSPFNATNLETKDNCDSCAVSVIAFFSYLVYQDAVAYIDFEYCAVRQIYKDLDH